MPHSKPSFHGSYTLYLDLSINERINYKSHFTRDNARLLRAVTAPIIEDQNSVLKRVKRPVYNAY